MRTPNAQLLQRLTEIMGQSQERRIVKPRSKTPAKPSSKGGRSEQSP